MAPVSDGADERAAQRRVDPELPLTRARRIAPASLAAVAAGGIAGTALRYGIGRAFPTAPGAFPWTTFVINVTGSFVLGAFLGWLLARRPADRYLRPLVAVGFLGGYTTFSTAMAESAVLVKDGHALVAVAYLVLGSATAFVAVALGVTGARRALRC
jgi:CrcB protein